MKVDCKSDRAETKSVFGLPGRIDGLRASEPQGHLDYNRKKPPMKKTIIISIAALAAAIVTASAADVKENWEKGCAKCHGPDGKGQTKMGQKLGIKDYTDAKVQSDFKDDEAFKAVKEGLKDKDGKILMKPAEGVNDDDIKALIQHVRSFK